MPPRKVSAPKRTRAGSRGSNAAIGRARDLDLDGRLAARAGWVAAEAAGERGERESEPRVTGAERSARAGCRSRSWHGSGLGPAGPSRNDGQRQCSFRRGGAHRLGGRLLLEQLGELLGHHAAELLGIHDGDGAAIVARHVVADADRDQLDRRARLDLLDHPAQVPLEIVAGIDRERRSRRPARRRRSSSGSCAARCARAGACAPSRAPRRRCSPSAGPRASSGRGSCARAATARRPTCR